jgi:hypothetical protein
MGDSLEMSKTKIESKSILNTLVGYLIIILFGLFNLPTLGGQNVFIGAFAGISLAFFIGFLYIALMYTALTIINKKSAREFGNGYCINLISGSFYYMIPFLILAVIAYFIMDWDGVIAFASAAMTTSAVTMGMTLVKNGSESKANVLVPVIIGTLVSSTWMLILSLIG